ncbi:DUF1961 family protein [Enterococcus sp. RIT-PI-f]|uniref:DUF1961 family protein n=1 Tax=Enterococcus sp. RIT-PI-f TaxID=1690244 RepID=UPI0006B9228F|nr:DUF1961 family protein [Enterococcus sp. RIT-PI-f]KPG73769.1 hypothetical protein AEQ18_00510 [Enterococcus sp. RIT-PI-f]
MELLYERSLDDLSSVADWIEEGPMSKRIDRGLIFENSDPASMGDHAHFTCWLPHLFPENIQIEWEFLPLSDSGLCMLFFAAIGQNGEDIFEKHLASRNGYYPQYHSGDINTYHISYFRRKYLSELSFRTANLRKSNGFHLVAQGADPLPDATHVLDFFQMKVKKIEGEISFFMNGLNIFTWQDDGHTYGPILKEGYIGFRQMAPMKAIYRNLKVWQV